MAFSDRDRGGVVLGVVFGLLGLGFLMDGLGVWTVDLVYVWPVSLIGIGTSMLMGRARRVEVEKHRSSQLLAAEERVRIARELHDIVAHSVSLMTVQIGAARKVMAKEPDKATQALTTAEETGRQSLGELRNIVSVLRSADASIEAAALRDPDDEDRAELTPLPRLEDLGDLISGFREAGLEVRSEVSGDPPEVSPAVELAVYRVVQESLTNVLRHAPAATAEVNIGYSSGKIEVVVADDGEATTPVSPVREGHGIVGMRERVASLGGRLEAGPPPGGRGWRVSAEIPRR